MGDEDYITEVGPHDVLFGRGSGPNGHDGNVRFRALVNQRKEEYLRTNHRQTKVKIAGEIVDQVLANGGRFLKRVSPADAEKKGVKSGEVWCAVNHETMMEKAKQALRQNLERHSMNKETRVSETPSGMTAPRVVTPGGNLDPFEPDPVREVLPLMAQQQQFQQQQNFSSAPANMDAWAAAQVNNSAAGFNMSAPQQAKVNSLSELTGSVEISKLIESIVHVRKDEYFGANDRATKEMIAREIVDAALAKSSMPLQGVGSAPNINPYQADILQQQHQQQQQQGLCMPLPSQANTNMPPPSHRPNNRFQSAPTPTMGGGGFNMYTMAAGRERSSSGTNQFPQNGAGIQPPHTSSGNFESTGGGFDPQVPNLPTQPATDALVPNETTDDQSLGDYQMMLEQYLNNTLGDSNSAMLSNPDLGGGIADQDSIGTFNQSDAGELESMAESLSLMSYSSKHKKGGGIDSFLSANAPNHHKSSSSKRYMSSASSRNSRSNKNGLKAHFSLEDQKKSKSRATNSSVMSGKSHRSSRSKQSSVKDDMSIMSGVSNFSAMSNDDHMSLMSEMTDLSEALNSLDLASQVLK